jgi:hypothetical protein
MAMLNNQMVVVTAGYMPKSRELAKELRWSHLCRVSQIGHVE